MNRLHGVFTALLTPFQKNGEVDYEALKKLVDFNLNKGVSGFYVCGSTSEAFLMDNSERKKVLETVMQQVNGKAAVIAHVGQVGQAMAVSLAKHANSLGVDAVSSVPPFYYGFSFEEIKSYYFALAEVGSPIIIYNFKVGNTALSLDNFKEFLSDPRFVGVKHTSSDFFMLERIKSFKPEAVVFNGFDEMFLSGLAAGADGGIGSTYNFMAEKFIKIESCFKKGDLAAARAEQIKANNIIDKLIKVGVMPGEKALCKYLGVDIGVCRKPFRELGSDETKELISVYEQNI